MVTGVSGSLPSYFNTAYTPSQYNNGVYVQPHYVEEYYPEENYSIIKIDYINFQSSYYSQSVLWNVSGTITIDGVAYNYSGSVTTSGYTATSMSCNITSGKIYHNSDGSKTITIAQTKSYVVSSQVGMDFGNDEGNLSSASVTLTKHTHSYTSSVTKEPTCTTTGVRTYTCSGCGGSYTETIAATGNHSYTSTITKQPTCVVDGVKTYTCATCGGSYTESIPATGNHSYVDTVIQPTCTEQGYTTHTCSICNDKYIDAYTSALGHNWEGANCSVCGTSSIVPFKRIVHIYDGENWVKHYVRVTNKRRQSCIYKNLNDNPENAILGFAKLSTMKLGEGG